MKKAFKSSFDVLDDGCIAFFLYSVPNRVIAIGVETKKLLCNCSHSDMSACQTRSDYHKTAHIADVTLVLCTYLLKSRCSPTNVSIEGYLLVAHSTLRSSIFDKIVIYNKYTGILNTKKNKKLRNILLDFLINRGPQSDRASIHQQGLLIINNKY